MENYFYQIQGILKCLRMENSSMNNLNNKNPVKEVYHVYDSEDPAGFAYP